MAERIGFDPETGLHLPDPPGEAKKEPVILEDCKICSVYSLFRCKEYTMIFFMLLKLNDDFFFFFFATSFIKQE